MGVIAICFGQFGPYHHARVSAFQQAAAEQGVCVVLVQIASATSTYAWSGSTGVAAPPQAEDVKTLCEGMEEVAEETGDRG